MQVLKLLRTQTTISILVFVLWTTINLNGADSAKLGADAYLRSLGAFEFQHADGQRNILVPNNGRMRTQLGNLQEASDRFASAHPSVEVEYNNEIILLPREAVKRELVPGATLDNSQARGYADKIGTLKDRAQGGGSVSKLVLLDGRYLPSTHAPRKPFERRPEIHYQEHMMNPRLTPLAYAGEGAFNTGINDVWIRDPKGRTFFIDGGEWIKVLKDLASDGEGTVSSIKPDILDLEERNNAALLECMANSGYCIVAIGFIAWAVWATNKKKPVLDAKVGQQEVCSSTALPPA
jgi:hypothetical protein